MRKAVLGRDFFHFFVAFNFLGGVSLSQTTMTTNASRTSLTSSSACQPPSPAIPGAWPPCQSNDTRHLDRVASFHQRLSLDLCPVAKSKSPHKSLPSSYSMPGSLFPSDDSEGSKFTVSIINLSYISSLYAEGLMCLLA
jgi:hypothetical protein